VPTATAGQARQDRRRAAAARIAHEQRVLAVQHHRFISRSLTLLSMARRRRSRARSVLPLAHHVIHRLRHGCFGSNCCFQREASPSGSQHRRRVGLAQFSRARGQVLSAVLHGIQRAHQLDRSRAISGAVFSPPRTSCARAPNTPRASSRCGHHAVVAAISVGQQNLPVVFEEVLRPSRPGSA